MGAAFGGGASQTLFGGAGASTFLNKATTMAAVIFMLTSLVLAYFSNQQTGSSVMQKSNLPIEQSQPQTPDQNTETETGDAQTAPPPKSE